MTGVVIEKQKNEIDTIAMITCHDRLYTVGEVYWNDANLALRVITPSKMIANMNGVRYPSHNQA